MEGPNGKFIQSTAEMFGRFAAELMPKLVVWQQRLTADPSQLAAVEEEVHRASGEGARPNDGGEVVGWIRDVGHVSIL